MFKESLSEKMRPGHLVAIKMLMFYYIIVIHVMKSHYKNRGAKVRRQQKNDYQEY